MDDCTCQYCYHDVCFHPLRGDDASLGVLCDGCKLEDLPQVIGNEPLPTTTFAITSLLQ